MCIHKRTNKTLYIYIYTYIHTCKQIVQVTSAESMAMARRLAKEEGVLCGISSGAAVVAALKVGNK